MTSSANNATDSPASELKSELKSAKHAVVKQHILQRAEALFAAQGYASTRMQDIAKSAGISLTTLYQFGANKQTLYREVLVARDREMLELVASRFQLMTADDEGPAPLTTRLLWLMQYHLGYLLDHPDYLRLILQEGYAWYHNAAQPTDDEQAMWLRGQQMIEPVMRQGMELGELVAAEPADQARMLLSLQQTRLTNWMASDMQESQQAVIARIQADFVRQFCRPAVAAQLLNTAGDALQPETQLAISRLES